MNELRIALQPKQRLFRESIETTPVTLYGGARGGGKSYSLRNILLFRRFQYPKSHGAIFRRTYPELEANHIRPLFQEHPFLRQFWNDSKKLLTLPNGSTLQFCHCANEQDVSLYQGREFHDLGIDEAGQWSEAMFRTLQGSNRSSTPGIPARTAITANPGGVGHGWLKRIFIERRLNERERTGDYTFIQALVDDNQALIENDPDYVHRLNTEPNEALRRAYRFGDWDIFAGQFFGEIRREKHLVKPFAIPSHWTRFGAYDFGFNHPGAFGWFACDEDGNVYLYRELVEAGLRIDQLCKRLKSYEDTEKLSPIVAGHDCWAKKNVIREGVPPTIAEEMAKHEIYLSRAAIDRVQGASQLRSYLAWENLEGRDRPRFFIFENCRVSFDTLSRMQHDPDRPEDVLKIDAVQGDPNTGDDAYDMTRYALMSRPMVADIPRRMAPRAYTDEWHKEQLKRMEEQLEREIERQQAEESQGLFMTIDDEPFQTFTGRLK